MDQFDDKQPWEEYYLEFDFTEDLKDEDVASAEFEIIDLTDDNADVTGGLSVPENQANIGKKAYLWFRGGEDGHRYKITCRAIGDGTPASKYEKDATIRVKEI